MQQSVMIADDSIPLHALIKAQLGSEDLVFHSVFDGTAAVSAAASIKPDLILLDIDMPNMDGFEACQKIKSNPITAGIPLMFLSAEFMPADKNRAIALGAFGYLQKPFRPEQLVSVVRSKLHTIQQANKNTPVDPVTGLWNKAYFETLLPQEFVLATLASQAMSCVITEIDQLGSINVRFGAKPAIQVYRAVARILAELAGRDATVCSLPNRRFATVYRNCDRFAAKTRCIELRERIAQKAPFDPALQLQVTCSFGICDSQIASAMTLFDRASAVLDRAINQGGDRIAVSRSDAGRIARSLLH